MNENDLSYLKSCVTLRPQWDNCHRGEAKVGILNFKTTWSEIQKASQTATERRLYLAGKFQIYSIFTSPPQCWSQAVVCASTPRMYPRSGYFLVFYKYAIRSVCNQGPYISDVRNFSSFFYQKIVDVDFLHIIFYKERL